MKRALISAVVLLLAGCTGVSYTDKVEVRELASSAEASIQVLGNAAEWRNTGVLVREGQRYRIKAEGRWRAHPFCNHTGPGGAGMYIGLCIPWDVGKIMVERSHQTLLGRIGEDGPLFAVGDFLEFQAQRDGLLYLHMNEQDFGVHDNEGSVTAQVALAALRPPVAAAIPAPAAPTPAPPPTRSAEKPFPSAPIQVAFKAGPLHPDDIAVVIGNADYTKQGKDIPDVLPAYADAEGVKRYAVEALGVREGNVIFLKDATGAQLTRVFGSKEDHRGQLHDWVKPGRSRVFVYYAGHGAPAVRDGSPYLVPTDADAARIELNGYPLKTLYDNLGKLPAESVTVVIEACFSGVSQGGSVISSASPVFAKVAAPKAPAKLTVISAGAADQVASWEEDKSHSLFTKYFLFGQSGEADKVPHGNGDGRVSLDELDRYLKDTLTYNARRYYGRDQTAQIVVGK